MPMVYIFSYGTITYKNMQKARLLIPLWVIENNCNIQSVFELQQHDDGNGTQGQSTFKTYDDHEPLQQLSYRLNLNDHGEDNPHSPSVNDLHDNDKKILSLLNEEIWSIYSFKALGRKLDMHQQSLSRALKRLMDLGLIEKTTTGYKLTKRNAFFSNTITGYSQPGGEEEGQQELYKTEKSRKRLNQLIQISIPIRTDTESIANNLAGKWFGNLRWIGLIKKQAGLTLQWVAINKYSNKKLFQINVHIVSEYIVMESDAASDKEKIEAMSYSNRIIKEMTKILQSNLQQECEIPNDIAISQDNIQKYANKIKHNFKNNS
jgi:DNA-binding transcriptional ArsR family regulator